MEERLTACPACDALYRAVPLAAGSVAECTRCGEDLYRHAKYSLDDALALAIAGLLLLILANLFPVMTFELSGREQSNLLISGVLDLYQEGFPGIALAVFLTTIGLPFCYLIGFLYVVLPVRFGQRPPGAASIMRLFAHLPAWVMLDVYAVGALVSYVKLAAFGSTLPGVSLIALFFSAVAVLAARTVLDVERVWTALDRRA